VPHARAADSAEPAAPAAQAGAKASTLLAFDIAQQVVRGELREGDALSPEAELVANYGFSRAVVREAMRLLEHDGFVSIRRGVGGGTRVRTPGTNTSARYVGLLLQMLGTTLADLDVALLALEGEAVQAIAAQRPAGGLALLREVLDAADKPTFLAADLNAFHDALGPATGNQVIGALFDVVTGIRARHSNAAVAQSARPDEVERDLRVAHAFHRQLLELLEAGDAAVAARRWQRHGEIAARALAQDRSESILDLFQGPLAAMDWEGGSAREPRPSRLPKGADLVAGEFRRRIASGQLREGESLPTEAEIMDEFGLSRAPVREAVRVLEADGLIIIKRGSHRGGQVRRPQASIAAWHLGALLEHRGATVGELLEGQRMLGSAAVALLEPASLRDGGRQLATLHEQAAEVAPADRVPAYASMHNTLIGATGNSTLRCLNELVDELLTRHLTATAPSTERRHSAAALGRLRTAERAAIDLVLDPTAHIGDVREAWRRFEEALSSWEGAVLGAGSPLRVFTGQAR
jgi:DNA-binding FadR family transcriptional regulator